MHCRSSLRNLLHRTCTLAIWVHFVALLYGCTSSIRFRADTGTLLQAEAVTIGSRWRGIASYYDDSFDGRITASGERFNQRELTAAHPWLPFGTLVRVHNLRNRRNVTVRINDRGPHVAGRLIDLSRRAAEELGMILSGTTEVEVTILSLP